MSTETRPAHSPLGASGAERWMNCPGSVALLKHLDLPETDEPDYRANGTAAHSVVERCLHENIDSWELFGEKMPNGVVVDNEIVSATQVFLDTAREIVAPGGDRQTYIEFGVDAPEFHKYFYGTLDYGVVIGNTMHINDYKHGEGIMVDVEYNPQIMYYAYGLLRHHPEVERVVCRIVQPRGFHQDGPVRVWETSADYIRYWAETELLPAMLRTELDNDLDAGSWCRFCPAKLVCPLMVGLFGAAATADPKLVIQLTDAGLGRSYQYVAAVKHYLKALEEETFRRLNVGQTVPGTKLVLKKANRVFKPGADEVFKEKYPLLAFTEPSLKSPAEMEKIGPEAKKLVNEYAYTPQNGLTVAPESDKRVAVKVESTVQVFSAALETLTQEIPNG